MELTDQYVKLNVSGLSSGIYQLYVENIGDGLSGFVRFNVNH
jgi:hypothetical protein